MLLRWASRLRLQAIQSSLSGRAQQTTVPWRALSSSRTAPDADTDTDTVVRGNAPAVGFKVENLLDANRAARAAHNKDVPYFNPASYQYIRTVGNRTSDLKDRLRAETAALFNSDVVMLSTHEQGELMRFLVQISNARKGLEIGTFTGLSALSLAEGFRDKQSSMLYTLDISEDFTSVAQRYWKEAGVDGNVQLIIGDAVDSLEKLVADADNVGTFDFAFVDGPKKDYLKHTELCLTLLRPGGFLILDNVMWSGKVADTTKKMTKATRILREVAERLHDDERVDVCMLPLSDGVSLVYKR